MFLETLKIAGYMNFREEFTVNFSKGLNVLVGENGVGKSAVIDAIRLILLEDEFGRRGISESDFHRPFQENAVSADSIHIQVQFGDLNRKEMVAFLPWSDLNGNAKLTLDVDNKQNNQSHFRPLRWGGAAQASAFERELFDTIKGRGSSLARLLRNINKNADSQNAIATPVKQFKQLNPSRQPLPS